MGQEQPERQIVVTESLLPIIRAGLANLLWFFLLVGWIMVWFGLGDLGVSSGLRYVCLGVFTILPVRYYLNWVARLSVQQDKLCILLPLGAVEFPLAEIEYAKIDVYGLNALLVLTIKLATARRARSFRILAFPQTSCGLLESTERELRMMLQGRVNVKEHG